MTCQIVALNRQRSFALSERTTTLEHYKTFDGEEKLFKICDNLSTVVLVSGCSRFKTKRMKDLILEYIEKTDFKEIQSVNEIKNTLNESISKSCKKEDISSFIERTFSEFEQEIKFISKKYKNNSFLINFLKSNSTDVPIDFLENYTLLNNKISHCINFSFKISDKTELYELKLLVKRCYYKFLKDSSPKLVLVGYDENYENPSYIEYSILTNTNNGLIISEENNIYDCEATLVISIAQDEDVQLSLMGFNNGTFNQIKTIILELSLESNNFDEQVLNSLDEKLKSKIDEFKLENLKMLIRYIEFLPESEIINLFDVLIQLTSAKLKFSEGNHTVGAKTNKAILHKYSGVTFIE